MLRIIAALVVSCVCVAGYSQGGKPVKPQALFSIKGESVTADEFIYLYKKNHPSKDDYTDTKIQEYLDLYINFKLKVTEARHRGIDTTAAFVKEFSSYKEELRKPFLPEGKIVDSLVKVTYSRLQEEIRASHILINCKPDALPSDTLQAFNRALEIKKRAASGEDFGSLASSYSEDPSAKMNKGDLGYFTALQMVFPFENAAYLGKKGDVVGPIRTRFGYHILKIQDRKPSSGQVEVSHIMIRTGERDAESAKNLIFELHDQSQGGVAWEELCKKYSEDQSTKNTGGKLRAFGVGDMKAIPDFERVAFSLQKPGEISDPFQTQYGWHIVRLEKKIPLPSFEESVASLKGKVSRDERVQISRIALQNKLKADFSFKENAEVKSKILAAADTSLTKGRWRIHTLPGEKETLFSTQGRSVSVGDFVKFVKQNQKPNSLSPDKYIDQLYNMLVEQTINTQLEARIIQQHPDFELLLKEYYEGILLFDIMEKEVWKKASDDSAGQRRFFEQNSKKYVAGERIQAILYSSASVETISNLKDMVAKNDSTGIQKILASKSARKEGGVYQKSDRPVFSKVEWKKGLYSVDGNGSQYLIQITNMVPPGLMSFEEARTSIISDYQDYLEKTWISQLKKKYPVKVNSKTKTDVFAKLKL